MLKGESENQLGVILKNLLKKRSLSMRKLSELTDIDTATISRIINGKRKANPEHLQKFANKLDVPISDLFEAAGIPIGQEKTSPSSSDISMSVESIQNYLLESSNFIEEKFSIASVEKQLANYEHYVQTDEGKENILKSFGDKLKKIGSIGPFTNQLQEMFNKFKLNKGTTRELVLFGTALIYFIVSVDVIPDYVFPVGYIDDVIALNFINKKVKISKPSQ